MQNSSQIITTNKPTSRFPTDRMPFLSPNQQCQSIQGKISHSMDLLTPSSPGGLPTLSVTSNSSWLPWGRVAMPLLSPLMPVPHLSEKISDGKWIAVKAAQTFASIRNQSASVSDIITVSSRWKMCRLASRLRSISLKKPLMSKSIDLTMRSVIAFNWTQEKRKLHRNSTEKPRRALNRVLPLQRIQNMFWTLKKS